MAAVGLFTLNTSKLNEGVLGGLGTGFAEATRTRTATAAGAPGFAGSASNASTRTATASGVAGFVGSATATRSTTSSATGAPALSGSAKTARVWQPVPQAGHLVWVARQVMRPHAQQLRRVHLRLRVGQVMSRHVAQPRRVHLAYSVRQVQRAQDRQARKAHQMCHHRRHHHRHHLHLMLPWGGPRLFYPPRPRKVEPQATHAVGSARGYRRARGAINGTAGRTGAASATYVNTSLCVGVRWPDDREIAQRKRRAHELELLIVFGVLMEQRELPDNYRPALEDDVPEGRACGNCVFFDETDTRGDEARCTRWDEYVKGGYYCNAWQENDERTAMGDLEFRTFDADITEIRAAEDGQGMTFGGYAWTYDQPSLPLPFTERIAPWRIYPFAEVSRGNPRLRQPR
jgi:hypothetical protein